MTNRGSDSLSEWLVGILNIFKNKVFAPDIAQVKKKQMDMAT